MNIKEHVFRYLDLLFSKAEQVGSIDENSKMGWVNEDNDTILSIVNTRTFLYKHKKTTRLNIHFSNREFQFITNMFALETGDAVDIIKEYISTVLLPDMDFTTIPFFVF